MAALDVVLNNADRKGGHVLDDGLGGLSGVDHGLTFNVDEKLRTVLWGWAGQPVDGETVEVVDRVATDLRAWCERPHEGWVDDLNELITQEEIRRDRPPGPGARPARPLPGALGRLAGDPLAAVLTGRRLGSRP